MSTDAVKNNHNPFRFYSWLFETVAERTKQYTFDAAAIEKLKQEIPLYLSEYFSAESIMFTT